MSLRYKFICVIEIYIYLHHTVINLLLRVDCSLALSFFLSSHLEKLDCFIMIIIIILTLSVSIL